MEYVRLKTFGRFGYQQMQLELYFLRISLDRFADEQLYSLQSSQFLCQDMFC